MGHSNKSQAAVFIFILVIFCGVIFQYIAEYSTHNKEDFKFMDLPNYTIGSWVIFITYWLSAVFLAILIAYQTYTDKDSHE